LNLTHTIHTFERVEPCEPNRSATRLLGYFKDFFFSDIPYQRFILIREHAYGGHQHFIATSIIHHGNELLNSFAFDTILHLPPLDESVHLWRVVPILLYGFGSE